MTVAQYLLVSLVFAAGTASWWRFQSRNAPWIISWNIGTFIGLLIGSLFWPYVTACSVYVTIIEAFQQAHRLLGKFYGSLYEEPPFKPFNCKLVDGQVLPTNVDLSDFLQNIALQCPAAYIEKGRKVTLSVRIE